MKKSNAKFIMIVISMLLASSLILGCEMHYVNESDEGTKDYEISHQSFYFESMTELEVSESSPTPQDELKNEFQSMYEMDKENNTITVISKEYLENYWESNYEKEEIKSLTYDEILFIIQDSIRIYQKYDKIILQGYESRVKYGYISESAEFDRRYPKSEDYGWDGDETEVIWRVPYIETKTISAIDGYYVERNNWGMKNYAVDFVLSDIYTIICYRIEALSSPKVFIQGAELLKKSGEDPEKYSGKNISESVYYCAGMKDSSEREEIIEIFRNQLFTGRGASISYRDLELIVLGGEYYSSRILERDFNKSIYVTNSFFVSDYEEVYMTDDMEQITKDYLNNTLSKEYVATQTSGGEEHNIHLTFYPKTNICSLMKGYDSYWLVGNYYFVDDILYLKGIVYSNEERICIFKVEGEAYRFLADTSCPMTFNGITLMDNITFYPVEKPLKWV